MENDINISTGNLREHLAASREELRMADELEQRVKRLKYSDALSGDHRCLEAENGMERTEELLSELINALETLCEKTEELIVKNADDLAKAQQNVIEAVRHFT